VGAGGLGALDVRGGIADEGAGGRVAVERVERPPDKVGVRFEQPRIRVGAADDHVDVLGQMMGLEVGLDGGLGVVADDGDTSACPVAGQQDVAGIRRGCGGRRGC
jgi:hypothetical protein